MPGVGLTALQLLGFFFFFFFAVLGLCYCTRVFSSCREEGNSLIAEQGLLIVVASIVAEHGLQSIWASVVAAHGLSDMQDLPRPEIEPMSPTLTGRLLNTGPPGTSLYRGLLI